MLAVTLKSFEMKTENVYYFGGSKVKSTVEYEGESCGTNGVDAFFALTSIQLKIRRE